MNCPPSRESYERGQANGVSCEVIDKNRLAELEPHAAGVRAIHVPEAGIVNYRQVCARLADRVRQRDGEVRTATRVTAIRKNGQGVIVSTTARRPGDTRGR